MTPPRRRTVAPRVAARLLPAAIWLLAACGGDGGGLAPPGRIAVLSAFPAELAAVLARMRVESEVTVAGRRVRLGTLGGVPVAAAMTGIGLVNAATTTRGILDELDVAGVVVSGVAGSSLNIGDVAAAAAWSLPDGRSYAVDRRWLRIAGDLAETGSVGFERCTLVPDASPDPVCVPNPPRLVVGGQGASEDPFGGTAFPCHAGAGDVYGCDAGESAAGIAGDEMPLIRDMETAAVAREAAAGGVPFIAFRAVSDGAGDPLGLPGFPAQFYAYYRLAANNAAATAEAFVATLGRAGALR